MTCGAKYHVTSIKCHSNQCALFSKIFSDSIRVSVLVYRFKIGNNKTYFTVVDVHYNLSIPIIKLLWKLY